MATIYQKSGSALVEKMLVIEPREAFAIPIDFGGPWTEMRIGMFFSGASSGSAYASKSLAAGETVNLNTDKDYFACGLISRTGSLHATAGTNFAGIGSNGANIVFNDTRFAWGGYQNNGVSTVSWIGTSKTIGTEMNTQNSQFIYNNPESFVAYSGFHSLKFTILNSGSASQSIRVASLNNSTDYDVIAPYTVNGLRTRMLNETYTTFASDITWNDGVNALAIPNCFYMWNPYYLNGIRISVLEAIKVS